jgi:hypothetical protein
MGDEAVVVETQHGPILALVQQVSHMEGSLTATLSSLTTQMVTMAKDISTVNSLANSVNTVTAQHTTEISNLKTELADLKAKSGNLGVRLATYAGPWIAVAALIVSIIKK